MEAGDETGDEAKAEAGARVGAVGKAGAGADVGRSRNMAAIRVELWVGWGS